MQAPDRKLPPAIVFDTALEESMDQVLALAMLLAYDARREARLASVSLSHNNLQVAAFCELLVRFYRGEQPGDAAGRNAVTVGMWERNGASTALPPMVSAVLKRTSPNGRVLYPRTIESMTDTADPVAVVRNALTAQQDQNAVVVLAGDPVNLEGLLALPEAKMLIEKKVRLLAVATSASTQARVDRLVEQWPGAVAFAGEDIDEAVPFPAASIEQDFGWTANHPVVDAYRAARAMPYDAPTRAMAALLYATHTDDNYFSLAETGKSGRRRITVDAAQKERVVQAFREAVSARPPERRGGRGGL